MSDERNFSELTDDYLKILNKTKTYSLLVLSLLILISLVSFYNLYEFITIYGGSKTYTIILNDVETIKTEYLYQYIISPCIFSLISAVIADNIWVNSTFQNILKELKNAWKE